jgi:hypothetical protein
VPSQEQRPHRRHGAHRKCGCVAGALPPACGPSDLTSHLYAVLVGIFIKNIIAYIEKSKSGLHKRFTLFTKVREQGWMDGLPPWADPFPAHARSSFQETGSPSGVVTLALVRTPGSMPVLLRSPHPGDVP